MKVKNKICPVCIVEFTIKESHERRYKGPFCCSRKCRGEFLQEVYKGDNNPNFKHTNEIIAFFSERCSAIKTRCLKNNISFNLTKEYLHSKYLEQNGLCYYTGLPLSLVSQNIKLTGQADLDTLSVDRVEPNLGYTEGNVVLCCIGVNKFKGSSSPEELQLFLSALALKSFGTCKIKFKRMRDNSTTPKRAKLGDAGFDLSACHIEHTESQIRVYTGIACQPSFGWALTAYPRSSICKKGLFLSNSVGLIDSGYTGEIIAVFNKLKPDANIEIGERIIQLVPIKTPMVEFSEVDALSETDRGIGGFGSTN